MFCWKADSLVSLVCGTGACRTLVPGDLSPKGAWERGQGGPPRWLGAVRAPATRAPGWAGDASAVRAELHRWAPSSPDIRLCEQCPSYSQL